MEGEEHLTEEQRVASDVREKWYMRREEEGLSQPPSALDLHVNTFSGKVTEIRGEMLGQRVELVNAGDGSVEGIIEGRELKPGMAGRLWDNVERSLESLRKEEGETTEKIEHLRDEITRQNF